MKKKKSMKFPTLLIIPTMVASMSLLAPNAAFAYDSNLIDVETNRNNFGAGLVDPRSSVAKMISMKSIDDRRNYAKTFDRQLLTVSGSAEDHRLELPEFETIDTAPPPPPPSPTVLVRQDDAAIEVSARSTEGIESFDFPDARFDVNKAIALAYAEVGSSRPTGWSAQGECIMSAMRWIKAGGGNWYGSGTPVNNYAGAERISHENVRPGDIMQYVYSSSPSSWVTGVHTLLITGVNDDGTFRIVESNNPWGSGLVTKNDKWVPSPPTGFETHFYRF